MTSHRDLDEQLRAAGRSPVPAPDAAFAQTLEDRLRAVGTVAPSPAPIPAGAVRRARPTALGVLAGATALTAVTLFLATRDLGGGQEVRVATATDTVVVLPDGTVGAVDPGAVVPDGSRIVTLPDGRAVAGDVELGPNREAVVDQGALRPSPTSAPPPPPASQPPATSPLPSVPPTSAPPAGGPEPEPQPDPEPVDPEPAAPDPGRPTRPVETDPDTRSTSATRPADRKVAALELEAVHQDTTVRLRWSPYGGEGFAAYLVLRADAPHPAQYPVDDHTTVVARITDPKAVQHFDAAREPAGRSYRVVAVDDDRRLLAHSPAVRSQPAAGDLDSASAAGRTGDAQPASATSPGVAPATATRD